MRYRRRIWCEMLPLEELAAPRALGLLRRFSLEPIVAAWPSTDVDVLSRALAAIEAEGLPVALWPMLEDREGRWANAHNAEAFVAFASSLLAQLAERGRRVAEVAIDLEPSIEELRRVSTRPAQPPNPPSPFPPIFGGKGAQKIDHSPFPPKIGGKGAGGLGGRSETSAHFLPIDFDRRSFTSARARIEALADALRAASVLVSAAVPPTVLLDPEGRAGPYQELLGTPVDGLAWDHASVMLYTSMIEGWSRGALRRDDARALLGAGATAAARRFGARAGVSIGCVGTGAFGNEPVLRDAAELADDVAITRAAGVDDLALFDLGGVLRRPDPEAWLAAFTRTAPAARVPHLPFRARAVLAGARLAGGALGALGRLVRR